MTERERAPIGDVRCLASLLGMAASLALAGCATATPSVPAVGTGWSRAPDLSVYSAMQTAGRVAREQDVLCERRNPAEVDDLWRAQFSEREAWIANALEVRYGAAAVRANAGLSVGREPCPTVRNDRWHRHHARLLHLLELRLYPKDHWSAG
jgi:hypothetical protein